MVDGQEKHISPEAFLPAAERYNLISNLDRWVVKNTFVLLATHPEFLKQIYFISINFLGQSLADESFMNMILGLKVRRFVLKLPRRQLFQT